MAFKYRSIYLPCLAYQVLKDSPLELQKNKRKINQQVICIQNETNNYAHQINSLLKNVKISNTK